jgi:mannose-1-phosphate guanylyltransferase/mannose-6-phosphate isomerase
MSTISNRLVPVILCGGGGTRLWPVSTDAAPKQFLPLLDGGGSTFEATLARCARPDLFAPPVIVANVAQADLIGTALAGRATSGLLLEPMRRDSAAAVAAAAVHVRDVDPDGIMLILAADHVVRNEAAFHEACAAALVAAQSGRFVTFGIRPERPATEYGYLRPGAPLADAPGIQALDAFIEKPDATRAAQLIADGCLWNSGNFVFPAGLFLEELTAFEPAIASAVTTAVRTGVRDGDVIRLDRAAFAASLMTSVDYAVMERTKRAAVAPCDLGWSDIGSWAALWDVAVKDAAGNAVSGDVVAADTSGSIIRAEPGVAVSVLGLEDVVVIAGPTGVLVTTRARAADIKKVVTPHIKRD